MWDAFKATWQKSLDRAEERLTRQGRQDAKSETRPSEEKPWPVLWAPQQD